jgi:hypothetical protein
MVGTWEIKYPGWTKTSTAARQLDIDLSGTRKRNLDQKSPGPPVCGLMQRANSLLIIKKQEMLKKPNTKPRKSDGDRRLKPRNRSLKFDTWDIQGCRNKIEEIIREINIMKMDVVVLTETRKKGAGSETLGNYIRTHL